MATKVIQWATGAMGKTLLRAIIDHPDLELAGLFVYSDGKAGQDAGTIARRPLTGITATRNINEILATDADVVVHAPLLQPPYGTHDDDIVRLLASGKNVVSINGYSYPAHWGGARLSRLQSACLEGGSSLVGAGLNPGFIGEKIAVTATSICSRVDHIGILETVDCREMRNPEYVFGILGFGAQIGAVNPNDPDWAPATSLNGMYIEVLAAIAMRLGWVLDDIQTDHMFEAAEADILMAAGLIARGTVGSTIWRWHGISGGRRTMTMAIRWTMEAVAPETPLWSVRIEGSPGVQLAIHLDRPQDIAFRTSAEQLGLAGAVMNVIPALCAAAPGVIASPIATPFQSHAGANAARSFEAPSQP